MRIAVLARTVWIALTIVSACAAPPREPRDIHEWLQREALPLELRADALAAFAQAVRGARVVGLGEATHGQHEAFELKRALTMHLIEHAGFRVVAYEASASRARACDDYVAGRSDDLDAALKGLGMLIWQVDENAALLRELREWNRAASERDRVRFIGIDVQDPAATVRRIEELLGEAHAEFGARLRDWASGIEPAIKSLWSGDPSTYFALDEQFAALERELATERADALDANSELALRLRELRRALRMHHSPGGRDRALAEMLLEQLEGTPARALVWAHNAHVSRGPLRHLSSAELGMGGCIAESLGSAYYALGFAFGEGEFQANAPTPEGRWGFRRYRMSAPPEGGLEAVLARVHAGDFLVDLRNAPRLGPIAEWLDAGHGQRWFGGYNVADDCDERTRDATQLLASVPRQDFDGLAFLARTSAAQPHDPALVLEAPTAR